MNNHHPSPLEESRRGYKPNLPQMLRAFDKFSFKARNQTTALGDLEEIEKQFPKTYGRPLLFGEQVSGQSLSKPLKVGVVFSGGQAPGGHNVITGLFDALKAFHHESQLFGFLGGPKGIVDGDYSALSEDQLALFRNQGGFDLLGSGRTKIETPEQFAKSLKTIEKLGLDGLVIIGGDDSNTNAALLAEYCLDKGNSVSVVGVPKTIDGDLKNTYVETTFGFDSACKTYAEMIGNLMRDARSAKKYTHFVRLMGRSASHIALECALLTHPNVTLIGEEIEQKKQTIQEITEEIATVLEKRKGDYGVVVIPEGIIEFIPEMKTLIGELNHLLVDESQDNDDQAKIKRVISALSAESQKTFTFLPKEIQAQLLLDRDPHGNVQVSHIATEQLFSQTVKAELKRRGYSGSFSPVHHFFGYEGRACLPTNFDATYSSALGMVAALLIRESHTGYMSSVRHVTRPVEEWEVAGIPITSLMNIEVRKGKRKAVIRKTLVDLEGEAFKTFERNRESWKLEDRYRYPGPVQFEGSDAITNQVPMSLL